jgi:hypothetical protein
MHTLRVSIVGLASLIGFLSLCPPAQAEAAGDARRAEVVRQGSALTAQAFGRLSGALQAALASGGVTNALAVCSDRAAALTAEASGTSGASVRRVSHRHRNPANAADAEERTLIAAWTADLAAGRTPAPAVDLRPDGSAVYRAPILLASPVCLQCHGDPTAQIKPVDAELIRRLYPHDQATGFKLGEIRGLWRVQLPGGPAHQP